MKYITGFIREQSGDSPCDSVLAELTFLFPGQTAYIFLRFWQTTDDSLREKCYILISELDFVEFSEGFMGKKHGWFSQPHDLEGWKSLFFQESVHN